MGSVLVRTFAGLGIIALVAGCGSPTTVYVVGDGGAECPAGQHRDTTNACVAGPPPECPAGAMKVLGEPECTPIGWSDCGEGFEKDPSAWGCREVVAESCSGATRGALGKTECVPVGDCGAAFPPPNARLFVSATGPVDATHFRSLESASLASRAGDVIAVDAGTYRESAQFDRTVTVVGRCAEKVIFDGTGITTPGLIIEAQTTVRGLTVRKFNVAVQAAASFDIEESVLEDNEDAGIYAEATSIKGRLARSVVRNTKAVQLTTAFGVDLALGTTMEIIDTEITGSQGSGIIVTPGSKLSVTSSVVRASSRDRMGGGGYGLNGQGGDATVTGSAFVGNADVGIRALKGATFTVDRTIVRGTKPGDRGRGHGMVASSGATLTASKVVITETEGVGFVCESATARVSDTIVRGQKPAPDGDFGDGVYVFNGGSLSLSRVAILDNARSGANVFDAKTEATFDHVLVSGTKALPAGDMGLGVAVGFGAHAKIDATVIASNHHTGIYVFDNATLDLTKSAIRDTSLQGKREPLGHGILVTDSTHVVISASEIRRSAGIGVALANSPANISSSVIADNAVGIHVQDGSTLVQVDTAPANPTGLAVNVTADTKFEGNATRIGSGVVPLPAPLPKL